MTKAPWQGGFWERIVGSVKRCIKKTVSKEQLTFSELQTILYEVENIFNNRPMCAVYDEEFQDILTPNHLLYGRKLFMCASTDANNEVSDCELMNLTKRAQYLENILETFWNIWKNDYLTSIRQIHQQRGISKAGIEAMNRNNLDSVG